MLDWLKWSNFYFKNFSYIQNALLREKGTWLNNIYNDFSMKECSILCIYTTNMYLFQETFLHNISETQTFLNQWYVMMQLASFTVVKNEEEEPY